MAGHAAEDVCLRMLPALTEGWECTIHNRQSEANHLHEFYQLSLALQKHRQDFVSSAPASINPEEPLQHRAGAMAAYLAFWQVSQPWSFSLRTPERMLSSLMAIGARVSWIVSCNGSTPCVELLTLMQWKMPLLAYHGWNLCLAPCSFRIVTYLYIGRTRSFAWAHSSAAARAFSYTWNESTANDLSERLCHTPQLCS